MQLKYCRKIFASHLRQSGIETEIVDLLQGRVPKSVFAHHYFTPSLDYNDKVIRALSKLKEQIRENARAGDQLKNAESSDSNRN